MSKPRYVARDMKNLKDMLEQTVALYNDKEAFVKKAKDVYVGVNYKKFKEDVFGLGNELMKRGVVHERVVLLSENRYEWCLSFMATVCGNGIAVPLSTDLSDSEIVSKINCVKAKFIVFSERYRYLVKSIKRKCPTLECVIDMDTIIEDVDSLSLLRMIEIGNKDIQNGNSEFVKYEIDSESGAGIFFGDTIVKDKPVLLSHKNFISAITGFVSFLPIVSDDKTVVLQPLSRAFVCIDNFLALISKGATVNFAESGKPVSELLIDSNPSIIFASKELFYDIYKGIWSDLGNMPNIRKTKVLMVISLILTKLNIDLRRRIFKDILKNFGKNLKLIVISGKDFKNRILRDFSIFGLNTVECYEMIEASSVVFVNDKKDFFWDNMLGKPLPGVKTCILNSNGKVPGEISISGDSVMLGYYDDKKATSKVMKNDTLYTEQTGYTDKNGVFYLINRKRK